MFVKLERFVIVNVLLQNSEMANLQNFSLGLAFSFKEILSKILPYLLLSWTVSKQCLQLENGPAYIKECANLLKVLPKFS